MSSKLDPFSDVGVKRLAEMRDIMAEKEKPQQEIMRALDQMITDDKTAKWDEWYTRLPRDIRCRLSLHDFKRLGDLFADVFNVR